MPANPQTPPGELVAVTQADRDAANAFRDATLVRLMNGDPGGWKDTPNDHLVQAFAAHRLAHAKEQAAGVSPVWALLYLHNWDPKREDGSQPIYPEVHRVYATQQEAEAARASKIDPEHYWVRRAHRGVFADGKDGFVAPAPASSVGEGAWMDMQSAPRDGTEILLFHKHHGQIQGRFAPGEWSEDTPISPAEYSGAVWVLGDDLAQEEVEELPEGAPLGIKFYDGQLIGWRPLYGLAPDRAPAPADVREAAFVAFALRCSANNPAAIGPARNEAIELLERFGIKPREQGVFFHDIAADERNADQTLAALRSPDDLAKGRGA